MRRLSILLFVALSATLPAQQKPATTVQLPPKPLLPMSFAGWTVIGSPQETTQPIGSKDWDLDRELGFKRQATGEYQKANRKLEVCVKQFDDATGAFGFFPGDGSSQKALEITPDLAGVNAYLRSGDTVAIIQGDNAPNLRDDIEALAKTLPIAIGSKAQIPILPSYLPKNGLDTQSIQYIIGPEAFSLLDPQFPLAHAIDFNTGAEVVTAKYGSGMLTLVEYPTPQMAAAQLKSFSTSLQLTSQKNLPDGLIGNTSLVMWRTGPLVGLASGMPQAQAIKLAGEVHYESAITWDKPQGYVSDAWRAAHLYLGIFALAGILCAASVILGLFFGGARAITRVMRGKSASAVQDTEFISLDLGHGGDYKPDEKN